MANYQTFEDAVAAGTKNMTIIRDNVVLTNSIDNFPCPVDWFRYNEKDVDTIYYSGSAYLGFGRAGADLRINGYTGSSDVRYFWYEHGYLVQHRYLKFRWHGFTRTGDTSNNYILVFDVYIIDNGTIVLDIIENGSSAAHFTGSKFLKCGSENVPLSIATGNKGEWTFTAADSVNGIGWNLEIGFPFLSYVYTSNGSAKFEIPNLLGITIVDSEITWNEILEEGTSIIVKKSFDNITYTIISNGDPVAASNYVFDNDSFYLLVEMTSSIPENTPILKDLIVTLRPVELSHSIQLEMMPLERFESTHHLSVKYIGGAELSGLYGGALVEPFEEIFTPTDLTFKGDQNNQEHISIDNIIAVGDIFKVYFSDYKAPDEHAVKLLNITASGVRTHIDDI